MFAYCGNNPVMYVDPTGYWATYVDFDEDDYDPLDDEDKFASGGGGSSNGNAGNVYVGSSNGGGYSGYQSSPNIYNGSVQSTSRGALRNNMLKEGPPPGTDYQAHHGLPWANRDYFNGAGLDVNDPYFGRWVKGGGNGGHQSWSHRYGNIWNRYIENHPIPDPYDIIDFFNKLNGG